MSQTKEQANRAKYMRDWRKNNPEKAREIDRRRTERARQKRESDPVLMQRHREYARRKSVEYRARNPERARESRCASMRKLKYGLTRDDFAALLKQQNGVCAICKRPPKNNRPLAVDHCHRTGQIRSLLCDGCNGGIGLFRDDPDALRAAADYLEKWVNA